MAKKKAGRPKVTNKVKVVSIYLTDTEKAKIIKKYGKISDAVRKEILPKC